MDQVTNDDPPFISSVMVRVWPTLDERLDELVQEAESTLEKARALLEQHKAGRPVCRHQVTEAADACVLAKIYMERAQWTKQPND